MSSPAVLGNYWGYTSYLVADQIPGVPSLKEEETSFPSYPTVESHQAIAEKVQALLDEARQIATEISPVVAHDFRTGQAPSTTSIKVVIKQERPSLAAIFLSWISPPPSYYSPPPRRRPERDKTDEKTNNVVIFLVTFIGSCVIAYLTGKALAEKDTVKDVKQTFSERVEEWETVKANYSEFQQTLIKTIISHVQQILNRKQSDKSSQVRLRVGLLATTIIVAVGAVLNSAPLMAGGAVGSMGFSVILIFKWGYNSFDKRNDHHARIILKKLAKLNLPPSTNPEI